jgi:membrane protease YdiL (CAAX protease family)
MTVAVGAPARFRAGLVASIGCAALAARPALVYASRSPTVVLGALFGALFVVGVRVPLRDTWRAPVRIRAVVGAAGVLAFAAGRVLAGGHAPVRFTIFAFAMNALAAVAEEVWFRRVCFDVLAPGGEAFAIAASSVLFALVHVALYGAGVVVVDLAAGGILGWQRAATGSWRVPAFTHVAANLFVLL